MKEIPSSVGYAIQKDISSELGCKLNNLSGSSLSQFLQHFKMTGVSWTGCWCFDANTQANAEDFRTDYDT
jgi:hypothetical protein